MKRPASPRMVHREHEGCLGSDAAIAVEFEEEMPAFRVQLEA